MVHPGIVLALRPGISTLRFLMRVAYVELDLLLRNRS
jgi:hypothetical protein